MHKAFKNFSHNLTWLVTKVQNQKHIFGVLIKSFIVKYPTSYLTHLIYIRSLISVCMNMAIYIYIYMLLIEIKLFETAIWTG